MHLYFFCSIQSIKNKSNICFLHILCNYIPQKVFTVYAKSLLLWKCSLIVYIIDYENAGPCHNTLKLEMVIVTFEEKHFIDDWLQEYHILNVIK